MSSSSDKEEETISQTVDTNENVTRLTGQQAWNIAFLILAFSCVVAFLTLIVGTGAVVIKSVGGNTTLAPFPLAIFFLGMALISLTTTHWVFERWGRKYGFWLGCLIALVGVVIACFGCIESSPALILIANIFLGAGTGISMYVRFAAVEVVPPEYSSRSISWVLCGGCLAAFAGPEAAQSTRGVFGDDNLTYLGVFIVAGSFCVAQAIFVGLVTFPSNAPCGGGKNDECQKKLEDAKDRDENADSNDSPDDSDVEGQEWTEPKQQQSLGSHNELLRIICHPNFYIPVILSALSWAIMAMPMSIFRITMRDLGYTERQSLTVIEFHFLSMYSPGFYSGTFIKTYGVVKACQLAIALFLLSFIFGVAAVDGNDALYTWYLGLILVGFGWNFGFSASTVWVTKAYQTAPYLKAKVQALNECLVFFISGSLIFSTGFLYDGAGGGGISGWRILNYFLLGLMFIFVVTIYVFTRTETKDSTKQEQKLGDDSDNKEQEEVH